MQILSQFCKSCILEIQFLCWYPEQKLTQSLQVMGMKRITFYEIGMLYSLELSICHEKNCNYDISANYKRLTWKNKSKHIDPHMFCLILRNLLKEIIRCTIMGRNCEIFHFLLCRITF